MTKADIVNEISKNTGIDKVAVLNTIEAFMATVKTSLSNNENVYLRGFGSFVVKKRAKKTARNISKNTTIIIPEHNIPSFKPAKTFTISVKENYADGQLLLLLAQLLHLDHAGQTAQAVGQFVAIA